MRTRPKTFGYTISFHKVGRDWVEVHIQRDLEATELRRLRDDLERVSGWVSPSREMRITLGFPLTKTLADALADLAEQYELPATIMVPSITPAWQTALSTELTRPGGHSWIRVVESGATEVPSESKEKVPDGYIAITAIKIRRSILEAARNGGKLRALLIGNKWYYHRDDVQAWIKGQRPGAV